MFHISNKKTMYFFTVIVFATYSLCSSESNTVCSTEKPIVFSKKQNEQIQVELLNLLGLPTRPKTRGGEKKLRVSSKFLLSVYRFLKEDQGRDSNRVRRTVPVELSDDELDKVDMSDTIITLDSVNKKMDRLGKRQKLVFSMRNMPKPKGLIGAELRIFQSQKVANTLPHFMYTISVYRSFKVYNGGIKMKKVAEKITSPDFIGWLSVDITYLFYTWLEHSTPTNQIYIVVEPYGVRDVKEIHPQSIGLILQKDENENQPFIIAYFKANSQVNVRLPRNAVISTRKIDLGEYLSEREKSSDVCNVYSFRVTFKQLQWSDWIIAPEGFTSSFCKGRCKFPLKMPINATNHAIVQSLVRLKHPDRYPEPICAPTKLNPLSILYQEDDNTILKKYNDMIVGECGCH